MKQNAKKLREQAQKLLERAKKIEDENFINAGRALLKIGAVEIEKMSADEVKNRVLKIVEEAE